MAEESDIADVQDLLPETAESEGWDEAKISEKLDAGEGNSVSAVVLKYWESRAARLYTAIDVSESGSSRSLSKLYDNARAMAEYWRDRLAAEESDAVAEEGRIRFNKINRV